MAVLKQTSPTAWPSAPRPKPSSTVPSASTNSAVGLWSGQAETLSDCVMSALHSLRMRWRQSGNRRIHERLCIFDSQGSGFKLRVPELAYFLKLFRTGAVHGRRDPDFAHPGSRRFTSYLCTCTACNLGFGSGDGGQPHPG